jgi:hypothetical protein
MIDLSRRFKFDDVLSVHPYFDLARVDEKRPRIRGNLEKNYNSPRNGVNPLGNLLIPEFGAYRVEVKWKNKTYAYFGEGEIVTRLCSHVLRLLYRPDNTLFKNSLLQRYGAVSDDEISEIISNLYFKNHWDLCTWIIDNYKGKKDPKYALGRQICFENKEFNDQKRFCSSSFIFSFFSCESLDPKISKRACELAESLLLDKHIKSKSYCSDYCLNAQPEWDFSRVETRIKNYLITYKSSTERGDQFVKLYAGSMNWLRENVKNWKAWLVKHEVD